MGIELSEGLGFSGRCDGCDTYLAINAHSPNTVQAILRHRHWHKADYIHCAHHYVWLCPKCKDKE